jgi:predicted nucleic acid-binding protein
MILVDTNVFSEMTKPVSEDRVIDWLHEHRAETLLSTLVIAELRVGIGTTPGPSKRRMLEGWLRRLIVNHENGRIVPFATEHAMRWGEFASRMIVTGERNPFVDSLLCAQALVLGVPVATRNVDDFRVPGVALINPWGI